MEDLSDLFGDEPKPVKGAKQRALERKQQGIAIAESAARIMQESKLNKARKSIEDLMGDTKDESKVKKAKAADKPKAEKPAKEAKPAKAAKAEKPAKAAKADKPASSGTRGSRGSGKFYFPEAGEERIALCKKVLAKVKSKISTVELAQQLETESWKVRLVVAQLAADKQLKMGKDGTRTIAIPK